MARFVYPELCPDCGHDLSRSRRRGLIEKLLSTFFKIGIFRCHRCGARFYSPPAVIVHARKTDRNRERDFVDVPSDFGGPVTLAAPEAEDGAEQVSVAVPKPPVSEKNGRPNGTWIQQPAKDNRAAAPALWVRSSSDTWKDDF